jgi:hypothetical protein
MNILPESINPLTLWNNGRDLPWGLGLVSLPQGLEMVTVFWQSALWRARFRLPVLVFKAVFRSHSPQAWNWYLHSARGRAGSNRNPWEILLWWHHNKATVLFFNFCVHVIVDSHAIIRKNTKKFPHFHLCSLHCGILHNYSPIEQLKLTLIQSDFISFICTHFCNSMYI